MQKSLNSLAINEKAVKFKNSAELVDAAICDSKSVSCVVRQCKECKDFPKLNDLGIGNFIAAKNAENKILIVLRSDTMKVLQFERTKYTYHEKEKKRKRCN